MVSFRQESEVYWDEWAAIRAGHGITENSLSYCSVLIVLGIALSLFLSSGELVDIGSAGMPIDSADCLVAGMEDNGITADFLKKIGYSIVMSSGLPGPDTLAWFDFVVLNCPVDSSQALGLYDYLTTGGSLLLNGSQPYFLGMPHWIGMRDYTNYWGSDFGITAAVDSPLVLDGIRTGDIFIYERSFVDGGAVLTSTTTAVTDACFAGVDSLVAASRNEVRTGRVAWVTKSTAPAGATAQDTSQVYGKSTCGGSTPGSTGAVP